jgi:carbamate kinase
MGGRLVGCGTMRIMIALGGNALLRRGEPLTLENQRRNVRRAAEVVAPLARDHELIVSHGNGPQVGLLALQAAAYEPGQSYTLDVLDAETEGQIGYLIEQELRNLLPAHRQCVTLLTQIEVDPRDPAFAQPTKPIGPVYGEAEAARLAGARGWRMGPDGPGYRRVVPSPRPLRLLEAELIALLVSEGAIVICAGGGGIPVVRRSDGSLIGVEAVIDKDLASSLVARQLRAHVLLVLTDVAAVQKNWGTPHARPIRRIAPEVIRTFSFAAGSMAPKVEAACEFVEETGGVAGIGRLGDAAAILAGEAGTTIARGIPEVCWWDSQ